MPRFDPEPRDHVAFRVGQRDFSFEVVEHPNAPDQVHAMEGGKATVFHLREQRAPHSEYALKVMKKQYMDPMLVDVCNSLDFLKQRAGLRVCERTCLSPQTARDVIQQFPTLQYSILMPWIRKLSWFDVLQKRGTEPPRSRRGPLSGWRSTCWTSSGAWSRTAWPTAICPPPTS